MWSMVGGGGGIKCTQLLPLHQPFSTLHSTHLCTQSWSLHRILSYVCDLVILFWWRWLCYKHTLLTELRNFCRVPYSSQFIKRSKVFFVKKTRIRLAQPVVYDNKNAKVQIRITNTGSNAATSNLPESWTWRKILGHSYKLSRSFIILVVVKK